MIVAIFSDVHGNLPALERFVELTRKVADSFICLGDVVNYGPWNDECLEVIANLPGLSLLKGNHEQLFLHEISIMNEIPLVQEFYEYSSQNFTRYDLIARLPVEYVLDNFVCTHTLLNKKIYKDSSVEIDKDYIIGHTHHQFEIQQDSKILINVGSIGQNRKNINIINYILYDTSKSIYNFCSYEYNFGIFINELRSRGYSTRCIKYYLDKF